jgi:hypothetical protein
MGIKPVPLTYPAEWMLDTFHGKTLQYNRTRACYEWTIPTPPMPWLLDWGWPIIGVLLIAEIVLLFFV